MLPRVLFCQLELTQGKVLYHSVCTLIRIILGFTSFSMLIIVTDLKENGNLFCEKNRVNCQHVLSFSDRYYGIAGDNF
jgi:hypothetical protein